MSGRRPRRDVPPLRHAATGILLPFFDTRIVPRRTMLDYLGVEVDGFKTLYATGVLTPRGGSVQTGATTAYIPAVIWAVNRWAPHEDTQRLLAASTPDLLRALADIQALLTSVQHGIAEAPPKPAAVMIRFPSPAAAAEG